MEDNKKYIKLERHKWPDEIEQEKKQTKRRIILVVACVLFFSLGFGVAYFGKGTNTMEGGNASVESEKLNEIYNTMRSEWYFGKDIEDIDTFLLDNAIKGLLTNEQDAHSQYFGVEESESFMQGLEGDFVGIGITYTSINNETMVMKVYANSPAKKAGIQSGDVVTKVNGIDIRGKTSEEVSKLTLGEEGTTIAIEIKRGNETKELEMKRETFSISSDSYVKDGVGVIVIDSFAEKTHLDVEESLRAFKKDNITKVIIDVRNNGGGLVSSAVEIASLFMDSDKVVIYEEEKDGTMKSYKTKGRSTYSFDQVSVLVNEGTASASEALIACLKDNIQATVVGTKTFGKGTVQTPIFFEDGSIFKFTVAEWLTPNKEKIHKKGITPDVVVENDAIFNTPVNKDGKEYKVDTVGEGVKNMQIYLKHLGYSIDRVDGYYSNTTLEAVKKYQKENGMEDNGFITESLFVSAYSQVIKEMVLQPDVYDLQLKKAIELTKE